MKDIDWYRAIQGSAREVLDEVRDFIVEGVSEKEIVGECVRLLGEKGITESWYHGVLALVLCGGRSRESVSGRDYVASDEVVSGIDLVTIDLSPCKDDIWGDCARSFAVEDGVVVDWPKDEEFVSGFAAEKKLHEELLNFVRMDTKFCELYEFANGLIVEMGFDNLDFMKNLGHSIETDISERKYIDNMNEGVLSSVQCFTFEPHIGSLKSRWGFKYENIYYFDGDGVLCEL